MLPVLFSIGPFRIYTYGTLIALGVWLAIQGMKRYARTTGFLKDDQVYDMVFTLLAASFFGARLFYVAQHADWYSAHPLEIPAVWQGGLIFYGGYPAGVAALVMYFKKQKIDVRDGFDFMGPFVALVHAFGRIGCFLNGCCFGGPCAFPWAIRFPDSNGPVHPAQLYEAVFDFALFGFLVKLLKKHPPRGVVTAAYFFLYATGRFFVEFLREDNPGWLLTWNQWISLGIMLGAGIFYTQCRTPLRQKMRFMS